MRARTLAGAMLGGALALSLAAAATGASAAAAAYSPNGTLWRSMQMSEDAMDGTPVHNGVISAIDYDTDVLGGSWPGFSLDRPTGRIVAWGGNRSITSTNFTVVTLNSATGAEMTRCTMAKSFTRSFVTTIHLLPAGTSGAGNAVALLMDESVTPQVYTLARVDTATCAVTKLADVSAFALMSGASAALDSHAGVLYWMSSKALTGTGGLAAANVTSGKVEWVKTGGATLPVPGGDQGPNFQPMLDPVDNVLYVRVQGLILSQLFRVDLAPVTAGGRAIGDAGAGACQVTDLWYKLLAGDVSEVYDGGLDYNRPAGSAQGPWLVFLAPYAKDADPVYPATLAATDLASCNRAPVWTNSGYNVSQDCSGSVCNDGYYQYDPFPLGHGAAARAAPLSLPLPLPASAARSPAVDPSACLVPMPTGSYVGIDNNIWDNSCVFRVYDAATGSLTGSVSSPNIQTFAGAVSNPLTAVDDDRKWFMIHAASTAWQNPGSLYVFSFSDPTAPDMVHNVTYKNTTQISMVVWDATKKALWAFGVAPATRTSVWGVVNLSTGTFVPHIKAGSIDEDNMCSCMDASGSRRVIWQASWTATAPFTVSLHAVYMDSGDIDTYTVTGVKFSSPYDQDATLYIRHDAAHDAIVLIATTDSSTSFGYVSVASLKAGATIALSVSPNSPLPVSPGAVTYTQEGSVLNLLQYYNAGSGSDDDAGSNSQMGYHAYALEVFGERVNRYWAPSAGMPLGTLYSTFTPGARVHARAA